MDEKSKQLGMPIGTAQGRLRKMVLFALLKKYNENQCYRCGKEITSCDELSLEHKKPWFRNDTALFWDLENVAFSHLSCNCATTTREKTLVHGTNTGYKYGCRCRKCKDAHAKTMYDYRHK